MTLSRRDALRIITLIGASSTITQTTQPAQAQVNQTFSMLTNPAGVALAVKDDKTFITNRHSLNPNNQVTFFNPQMENLFSPRSVRFPNSSLELDIAIFSLQRPQDILTLFEVSRTPLQRGQEYFLILNNDSYALRIGEQNNVFDSNHNLEYQIFETSLLPQGAIFPGLSGSPLLNERRELIGILSGHYMQPIRHEGRNYVIPFVTNVGGLRDLL